MVSIHRLSKWFPIIHFVSPKPYTSRVVTSKSYILACKPYELADVFRMPELFVTERSDTFPEHASLQKKEHWFRHPRYIYVEDGLDLHQEKFIVSRRIPA